MWPGPAPTQNQGPGNHWQAGNLANFLQGRMQKVVIKGTKSESACLISGVPQGSVLGPILFLIHISDISEGVRANIKTYVDDSKTRNKVSNYEDVEDLQNDLKTLYTWGENNMLFNVAKFQILRYGKNEELKNDIV